MEHLFDDVPKVLGCFAVVIALVAGGIGYAIARIFS